jgi:hypothetical protein
MHIGDNQYWGGHVSTGELYQELIMYFGLGVNIRAALDCVRRVTILGTVDVDYGPLPTTY